MIVQCPKINRTTSAAFLCCVFFLSFAYGSSAYGSSAYGGDTATGGATVSVPVKQGPPSVGPAAAAAGAVASPGSSDAAVVGPAVRADSGDLDKSKSALSPVPPAARTRLFSTLVGDLPKSLLGEKGPYLITSDVYVPAGKTVTIEPGVVLLFKNFTGVHVQGTLNLHGTPEKPVIFTSENDRRFNPGARLNPNPYDWNGIFIHDDAIGTDLQNFEISYSVYGINTLTKFIRITNGAFHDNGRANLTIEGMPQTVTAGQFSYSLSVKNATIDGVPVKILTDPDAAKRNTLRIGGLAVFLSGCAVGAIFTMQTDASQKKMNTVRNDLYNYQSSDFISARTSRNTYAALMTAGYTLGLAGAAGFYLSFRY
jgi:hypothetical protein